MSTPRHPAFPPDERSDHDSSPTPTPAASSLTAHRVDVIAVTPLSATELAERERCEAVVRRGLRTFLEVAEALMHLRDQRLYRSTHPQFDAYCVEVFGFGANYARRLVHAAAQHAAMQAFVPATIPLPEREAQLRPLTQLPPAEAAAVWVAAVQAAPHAPTAVTQAQIQTHVAQHRATRAASAAPAPPLPPPPSEPGDFAATSSRGPQPTSASPPRQTYVVPPAPPHEGIDDDAFRTWLAAFHDLLTQIDLDRLAEGQRRQVHARLSRLLNRCEVPHA